MKRYLSLLLFTSMAFAMLVSAKDTLIILASMEADGSLRVTKSYSVVNTGEYSEMSSSVLPLNDSEISNVMVWDETKTIYKLNNFGWKENYTAEEATNRCGVTQKGVYYMIHWGMGNKEGERMYNVSYTLSNMTGTYEDCDALDAVFFGNKILDDSDVRLVITSPVIKFTEENAQVNSYGFESTIKFRDEDGAIVITPTKQVGGISHVVVKVPKGTFNTAYKADTPFDATFSRVAQAFPVGKESDLFRLVVNVELQKNGDARVTETRQMLAGTKGTECYIKFYNMNSIELKDISVSDETLGDYTVDSSWNLDRSRDEKRGHCGINSVSEGYELCWGLGHPGHHTYTVSYTLTNLVKAYKDFDGFNHNFYEASDPAALEAEVHIRCAMDSLKKDNAKVWAFGFMGDVLFENGEIVARGNRAFNDGEKIIVLMQFDKGFFIPASTRGDESFVESVKKQAFEGSDYDLLDEGDGSKSSMLGGNYDEPLTTAEKVGGGICCIAVILPFILPFYLKKRRTTQQVNRLLGTKKMKDVQYFRDLPADGNLLKSRLVKVALASGGHKDSKGLIEAFILRLVYKGKISVVPSHDKDGELVNMLRISAPETMPTSAGNIDNLIGSNTSFSFDGKRLQMTDDAAMYCLQQILYEAAGDDHLLQPKELKTYIQKEEHALKARPFARALQYVADHSASLYRIESKDAQEVVGFWNFLNDFTLVKERALQEVGLWKEYLVFASAFDIADQVRRDMKTICPDYTALDSLTRSLLEGGEMSAMYDSLSTMLLTQMLFAKNYETYSERAARIERERQYERSSGGGGSSSYGGGGGYSGGGGSGVR